MTISLKRTFRVGIRLSVALAVFLSFVVPLITLIPKPVYASNARYWVGGSGNWNDTNHWSTTSGGPGGASVPTSADDVYFDANSFTGTGQTVTVNVTAYCRNMDWSQVTNTPDLKFSSSALYIFGNVVLKNMTTSSTGGVDFCMEAAAGVTQSLTTNGVVINARIQAPRSGSTVNLMDDLTCWGIFWAARAGTLNTNNYNITVLGSSGFNIPSNAGSRTINLGSSIITAKAFTVTDNTNLTFNAGTSSIRVSDAGTFTGGGLTYYEVQLNGTSHTISDSNTFTNLIRNGTATKTDTLTLTSGTTQTVTGTCKLSGNSSVNRLLVQSSTLGSAATINLGTAGICRTGGTQNVDFMDITMTNGAANERDLSAISGSSGDCGGNSGITFTASATQTWDGTTGSWSNSAKWTSRVPLPQDDVTAGGTGNTITVDMPRIGRSITFTGTPTVSLSNDISNYGSWTMTSGMTYTHNNRTNFLRGRNNYTLTTGGKTIYNITLVSPSGTCTLQDNLTVSNIFALTAGALIDNGKTITLTATGAITKWNCTGGSLTATGAIILTSSGASAQTFAGNGLTYSNVTVAGTGDYALTITGSNTFNTFTVDRSQANKTLTITAGTTQTFNNFVCGTSGTRTLTINSTTTTPATFVKSGGGHVCLAYLNLSYNTGSPVNTWYYGLNCTIGSGVTGWYVSIPTVTTLATTDIEARTATLNGSVTSINDTAIQKRGFVWDTSTRGNPGNVAPDTSGYTYYWTQTGNWSTGTFSYSSGAYEPNTTYYVRAVAQNSWNGWAYGSEVSFTTDPPVPPTVTTDTCTGFTAYSAIVNGYLVDDGSLPVIKYGFDYGLTTDYGESVVITKTLTDNTPFWCNLTGLLPATVYHYRAKTYSNDGWGYGDDKILSTKGLPVLYEYLNTGQNGDSIKIYANNWAYMQFTVGDISHTVTKINLYIKRLGSPSTVTLSLRRAAGGKPTGGDLVSTTFDGDAISTNYTMYGFDVSETNIEANQQYAIVVRAIAGDSNNCIYWGLNTGGGLANAVYGTSTNGGLSFSSDSPKDALFEIWGNPCFEVVGAKVFTGYKQANDWLIVADVNNTYVPYFPDQDSQLHFQLQLISDSTIKATANFRAWQRQPLAIYLNANTASGLQWGSNYKIRIQALFNSSVYSEYALVAGDWQAGSLLYLDSYVRTLASSYETYYNTEFLTTVAGSPDRVLNAYGSTVFMRGIPGLETARPGLFYTNFGTEPPGDREHNLFSPNPSTMLGMDVYNRIVDIANLFGTDTSNIIGWILLSMALIIGIGCVGAGHGIAGLIIGMFFAGGAGFVFGGIPIAVLGIIGLAFVLLIAIWLSKLMFRAD